MAKKNNPLIFYKSDKVMEYVLNNKSLIEGKIPEIIDCDGNVCRTDSVLHGANNPAAAELLTDAKNLYYHTDILTLDKTVTITFDIGFETHIDAFALLGFHEAPYQIFEFELYASLLREDLYNEDNKYVHFLNEYVIEQDKKDRRNKNFSDGYDVAILKSIEKARYFGIKIIKANKKDSIARIVRLGVYSNEYTAEELKKEEKTRYELSVNTSEIVNDNFYSFGGNIIPGHLMEEQLAHGYSREYFEVEKSQLKHLKLGVARLWFQPDWITDNENDYANGVYTFHSDKFEAACEYIAALKEANTEIELNFGWKTAEPVCDWFSKKEAALKESAAPADLPLFAKACVATLRELIEERGLDNVKYVTFYNEPSPARDFGTHPNWDWFKDDANFRENVKYWHDMATEVKKELEREGMREKVAIWGAENAPGRARNHLLSFTRALEELPNSPVEVLTYHHYNYFSHEFDFTRAAQKKLFGDKPIVITEHAVYRTCWDNNYAQMFIDCANYGYSGYLIWCASTSIIPQPLNFTISGTAYERFNLIRTATHKTLKTFADGVGEVGDAWSQVSIFTNYVPSHSKVLKTVVNDDGIRMAAFITPSGEYTVIVEANHSTCDREIEISFDKAINKNFRLHKHSRKYSFRKELTKDQNGIIPPVCDEIMVSDKLKFKVDKNYNILCFTTMPPAPQVVIDYVNPFILPGESVKLNASLIDAEGEIEWSCVSGNGSVDEQGVVTLGEFAQSNEMVAVKAQIRGTDIYSVAVVQSP